MKAVVTIPLLICSVAYAHMSAEKLLILEKKAESNDSSAQLDLGLAFAEGDGVEQDFEKAIIWWTKSAALGNARAQFNLGLALARGDGVQRNYPEAFRWYRRSIERDEVSNKNNAKEPTLSISSDYAPEAFSHYLQQAQLGDATAQFQVGYAYENGLAVLKDEALAVQWYLKSAANDNARAQRNLGFAYFFGTGVKADYTKAVEWWIKSSERGDFLSQVCLGIAYHVGLAGKKNDVESYAYFSLASKTNGDAKRILSTFELQISPEKRAEGLRRAKELQELIDAKAKELSKNN